MPIRIVTDSNAYFFEPDFARKHNVRVVPLGVRVGESVYIESEITTETLLRHANESGALPVLAPPSAEQFAAVFEELTRETDVIIAILMSDKLSRVPHNARLGAEALLGRCTIHILDSQSVSIGLGSLVEIAVRAVARGASADEVVKAVRAGIHKLYGVFFCETMAYSAQLQQVGKAHAILGEMLDIKPVLALEDGDLIPIEKARTRAQAIEHLVEYAIEFPKIERCAILQATPKPNEDTRALLEQLAAEVPGQKWPIITYPPSLAALLGPNAMGILVHEGESVD
ncbi:MAG: DegV family protein [Anaerolineales bacterium]